MPLALPSYERDQLISIIGNKRSIGESLKLLFSELKAPRGETTFIDPFCGSGAISRIARNLGMGVKANDNQPFAHLVNYVYLTLTNDDLSQMFREMGGIDAYFSLLNLEGLYAYNTEEPLLGGTSVTTTPPKTITITMDKRSASFLQQPMPAFLTRCVTRLKGV